MDYLDQPPYHHFQEQLHHGLPQYSESHQQHMHSYALQQSSTMMAIPNHNKTNETKPRLGKEEVEILELEFKKNPKPTTQTKRSFAEEMGVELARINNWFQNRRAKRKQERKQEAYEAGQAQEALGYSEPSSPDNLYGSSYFLETNLSLQHATTFPMMNGPPPAAASYNPRYTDPSSASMESLHRTLAAAQAASEQQDFSGRLPEEQQTMASFGGPLLHAASSDDRAQFPSSDGLVHFDENQNFSYDSAYPSALYTTSNQRLAEPQPLPNTNHTTTPFHSYSAPSRGDTVTNHVLSSFPSQLLLSQSHDGLPSIDDTSSRLQDMTEVQSPGESSSSNSTVAIGFKVDAADSDSSISPPTSSIPFKSPPPPTDLASRRKKAVKPVHLSTDITRGRPSIGPRTVSHAEGGFRRPSDSPIASPMRRIVSAGGNRSVVSGRIGKSGIESAQRSPINLNGFADARAFMEHNYHTTQRAPSLTAGSSLNSSLAPPTPMSPHDQEMTLVKRDGARSTASPVESGMNYVFNTGVPGCFTSLEDQNLASPPETPQAQMALNPMGNGWPAAVDYQDKQWHFEVPDEPLYTPATDQFPIELQMPQPAYLSSLSQPVTPAFGQFNPHFMFGSESPQHKTESPQFLLSSHSEYSFPDSHYPGGMMSASPVMKQKTFQFSNTTAADFSSEK